MTDSILRSYQRQSSVIVVPSVQRVNIVEKTQAFDNAIWVKSNLTVSANALTAPDSTATAEKMTQTAVANDLYQVLAAGAGNFTASIFLKAVTTCQWIRLSHSDGIGSACTAWFDILNGVVGTTTSPSWTVLSTSIIPAGSGWYRIIDTFSKTLSNVTLFTEVITANADGSITGSASGTEYGVWGWQVQTGSIVSDYEPHL